MDEAFTVIFMQWVLSTKKIKFMNKAGLHGSLIPTETELRFGKIPLFSIQELQLNMELPTLFFAQSGR